MTAVLKALLCGQTKKLAVLGSGLQCNQTTGTTKTVCTLLALGMDTLGMTCHVISASTSLVLQVTNFLFNAVNIHCNLLIKKTCALKKVPWLTFKTICYKTVL